MGLETTYLSRTRFSPPRQDEQACYGTGIVHAPRVEVPGPWLGMLPYERFVTVLPYHQSAQFRSLCRTACIVPKDDGHGDVISVLKGKNWQAVWLTGIFQCDGSRIDGVIDFGGERPREVGRPNIAFTVLYGYQDTIGFDWPGLFDAL